MAHIGVLLAFCSAFSYSATTIAMKKGNMQNRDGVDGYLITLVINVVFLTLLLTVWSMIHPGIWQALRTQAFFFFFLGGFLTTGVGRFVFYIAIEKMGPSRATALKTTTPLWTVIFSFFLLGEVATFLPGVGMVLIAAAVGWQAYNIYFQGQGEVGTLRKSGYFFALGSAVSLGLGVIMRKYGLMEWNEPLIGAWIGCLTAWLVYSLIQRFRTGAWDFGLHIRQHANLYYGCAGIFSALGPLCFFLAMNYTKVSYIAMVAASESVITTWMSYLLLRQQEELEWRVWASALLVCLGGMLIAVE